VEVLELVLSRTTGASVNVNDAKGATALLYCPLSVRERIHDRRDNRATISASHTVHYPTVIGAMTPGHSRDGKRCLTKDKGMGAAGAWLGGAVTGTNHQNHSRAL
jgi:hypothetical protein